MKFKFNAGFICEKCGEIKYFPDSKLENINSTLCCSDCAKKEKEKEVKVEK